MWFGTEMYEIVDIVGVVTSAKWKRMFDNSEFTTKHVRYEYTMLRTLEDVNNQFTMI